MTGALPGSRKVFIIESLDFDDEDEGRREGEILSQILHLSGGIGSVYYYFRTSQELKELLTRFHDSGFRYLHLSCHGNSHAMATTLDEISVAEFGQMLRSYVRKRRVFLSACEMATEPLAQEVLQNSGCYSLIGPAAEVGFGDAALLWASFYHLMFRGETKIMTHDQVRANLKSTANLFGVPMNYFQSSKSAKRGYRFHRVRPVGAT